MIQTIFYVVKLVHTDVSWISFRDKFKELGGDGIYAPWKLTYQEPFYQDIPNRETQPFCPIAEELQRTLLQFKTNYWEWSEAEKQAKCLKKTIDFFKS